jgi:hypothetical protein
LVLFIYLLNKFVLIYFSNKLNNFFGFNQIVIGVIVEIFTFIPSLLLVQLFRRTLSRQSSAPLREILYKLKQQSISLVKFLFILNI